MYDREKDVKAIEKLLSEGRHIQVCGPRKVGKTTILENLNDRLETKFYYFNCETTGVSSPVTIANSMKRLFHVNTPREAPEDSWVEVMYEVYEFLKRKNTDCIIIIDELSDSLDKMTEEERHEFLDGLLWIPDKLGIQMIICGSIGFDKILENYKKAYKIRAMFVPLYVEPFDEDTAQGFIKECFLGNGQTLPDGILSVLTESITMCFGKDSLFPLFLDRFITHTVRSHFRSSEDWQKIITNEISNDKVNVDIDPQKKIKLEEVIKEIYDGCLQQVVDVYNRRSTGGGPLQDLIGYIHLIEGDLTRTGTLSRNRTQLVTRILLMGEITPVIISSFKDQGIETILNTLSDNYLIKSSGDNYISYLKFLGDVWSRLHPLEGELEERRD
ncbi:MAG: ATP-binding protein [Thermoplasmata archaeon]|nr:MAG: ATP-binding protein [Thermoplasmata archaeon]